MLSPQASSQGLVLGTDRGRIILLRSVTDAVPTAQFDPHSVRYLTHSSQIVIADSEIVSHIFCAVLYICHV
jgi:hypothetical protein